MKSASINMIMSIVTRVISLLAGLIVQRYLLLVYGSTLNGLTTSINQAMAYLVLLEAGLGTASVQALYNPLSVKDWGKISGILTATGEEYKKVSAVFFCFLMGISIIIPLAVSGEVEFATAGLLTLITGGSYVVSYVMGGKYKVLLDADRRIYVLYALDSISIIISCILRVWALKAGIGIILVQLINLGCIAMKNIGYTLYVRIKYNKVNYKYKPDFRAIGKRWNVLIHSIAGIVVNNTDIIILTLFASLKTVSIYGIYNMVFGQLSSIIQTTFMQAPQSSFGSLFYADKEKFKNCYEFYEFLLSLVLFEICSISLVMVLPFVELYTNGVEDVNYIDRFLPILFTFVLLMNQIRIPALITINVAGHFKETQRGAIIEAIINITVSLTLFFFTSLGIYGLLLGTVCSYIFRTTDVIIYTYKHLVDLSIWTFVKNYTINFTAMLLVYYFFYYLIPIHANSVLEWILQAIVVSFVIIVIFSILNFIFNREKTFGIYSLIKERIRLKI